MAIDFAAVGMDGAAAAAAEGLSGLCFLAGLGLDHLVAQDLTPEQREALETFRNEALPAARAQAGPAAHARVDEFTLVRFLRADKFNPQVAAARLAKTLQWRADNRVDHVLAEAPMALPVYRSLRIRTYPGWDRQGNILMLERLGEFFGSDCGNMLTIEEWLKCYTHDMAMIQGRMRESSKKHGRPISRITYVGDLAGLRMRQCLNNLKVLKACAQVIEVHFPEQAGQIFLINAPPMVAMLWSAAKRILDPAVAAKVNIFSGVPTEKLLEIVEPEVLPQELGGRNPLVFPHAITCHEKLEVVREASRHGMMMPKTVEGLKSSIRDEGPWQDMERRASICGWPWLSCLSRGAEADDAGSFIMPSLLLKRPTAAAVNSPRKEQTKEPAGVTPWVPPVKAASFHRVASGGMRHLALFVLPSTSSILPTLYAVFFSLAALHLALAVGLPAEGSAPGVL
mmetsp:Transcript_35742/g.91905  ORF Transcript_35742/g.91905 Transcript_35742/m.91905 type:complete len:454 (-) Transcript_35742:278-1639(-)